MSSRINQNPDLKQLHVHNIDRIRSVGLNGQRALDVLCILKVNDLTDILARYRQHLIYYVMMIE
jgi:hypothetical protein